jgi:Uncharacterized conserved protein
MGTEAIESIVELIPNSDLYDYVGLIPYKEQNEFRRAIQKIRDARECNEEKMKVLNKLSDAFVKDPRIIDSYNKAYRKKAECQNETKRTFEHYKESERTYNKEKENTSNEKEREELERERRKELERERREREEMERKNREFKEELDRILREIDRIAKDDAIKIKNYKLVTAIAYVASIALTTVGLLISDYEGGLLMLAPWVLILIFSLLSIYLENIIKTISSVSVIVLLVIGVVIWGLIATQATVIETESNMLALGSALIAISCIIPIVPAYRLFFSIDTIEIKDAKNFLGRY